MSKVSGGSFVVTGVTAADLTTILALPIAPGRVEMVPAGRPGQLCKA